MAETNIQYINRKLHRPWTIHALKAAIMVSVAFGAVRSAGTAWALGDLGVGLMAWLNIIGIIILQQPAYKALWDYEKQKKAGLDPTFDPIALDIAGARFWETYDPLTGRDREAAKV
jgi:AGCS family alanine or glycine:cation symporter